MRETTLSSRSPVDLSNLDSSQVPEKQKHKRNTQEVSVKNEDRSAVPLRPKDERKDANGGRD